MYFRIRENLLKQLEEEAFLKDVDFYISSKICHILGKQGRFFFCW